MIEIKKDWQNYEVFLKKGRNLKLASAGMICYYLGIIKSVDTNQLGVKFDLGNFLLGALILLFLYSSFSFYQACYYEKKMLKILCKKYLRIFKIEEAKRYRLINIGDISFFHHVVKPLFISFPIKNVERIDNQGNWIKTNVNDYEKIKIYISRRAALCSLKDIFIRSIAGSEFLLPWLLAFVVTAWGSIILIFLVILRIIEKFSST
ncbi:hypothetical protein P0136_03140 [Lentisphaerota bacterium ZTH]|nr:hypothetical protein JYG24_05725 [Lentisphaerota bacterium]WET06997.1 hypothetical protein P0136_03140 [Lentisphaerota bacterium ZTH]